DIPALGYVCVPYAGRRVVGGGRAEAAAEDSGRWVAIPGSDNDLTLEGRHLSLKVDLESGAIRSLVTVANGREWGRRGSGVNAAPRFRLDTLGKFQNRGVGTRLVAVRRSADGASLSSSITVYENLPWVDIVNEGAGGTAPPGYG